MLAGTSVVVTGAGAGLGRAYALDLAANGAAVLVNDIDGRAAAAVAAEITATGARAEADEHTVADARSAAGIIAHALDSFGRLDGLVNNAGIFHSTAPAGESLADAAELVQVNLLGTLFCGLSAIRHFVAEGRGVIVNDTSGALAGLPRRGTYGATKGATMSLTYSWAADLAEHGIRVNAVSPMAKTEMVNRRLAAGATNTPPWPPSHVAPLVTYLISDDAAAVTGRVIRLDGPTMQILRRPGDPSASATSDHWDHRTLAQIVPTLL